MTKMNFIKDTVEPVAVSNRIICPYYRRWKSMQNRVWKYYTGVTICDEWHLFSNFRDWMMLHDWEGKELDKDIIDPLGPRIYSPWTCAFVTKQIQQLIIQQEGAQGFPPGVRPNPPGYSASMRKHGRKTYLGQFTTIHEAANAYRKAKAAHIREIALQQDDIRIRVGLMLHADIHEDAFI
jgi:hypothetical protein